MVKRVEVFGGQRTWLGSLLEAARPAAPERQHRGQALGEREHYSGLLLVMQCHHVGVEGVEIGI